MDCVRAVWLAGEEGVDLLEGEGGGEGRRGLGGGRVGGKDGGEEAVPVRCGGAEGGQSGVFCARSRGWAVLRWGSLLLTFGVVVVARARGDAKSAARQTPLTLLALSQEHGYDWLGTRWAG